MLAQHHAFCATDQLAPWPDACMPQLYGKPVVEVVALVCVMAVMVVVTVTLDNEVFVRVKLVLVALVAVAVPVAVIVIVWLVLVMDALVAVDVLVAVVVIDLEFVSVKLVGVLEAVVVDVSQPMSSCLQHQANFAADHPETTKPFRSRTPSLTPAEQSKGSVVNVVVIEVLVRVPDVTVCVALVSVTRVSDDVIVRVEVLVTDVAVGWHPTPMAEQQNTLFSCDQLDRSAPKEQLYSNGVSARRTCVITTPASSTLSGEMDVALVAPSRGPGSSFCSLAPFGLGEVALCVLTQDSLA